MRVVSSPKHDGDDFPDRLYGFWSEPITIPVDVYKPPPPAAIDNSSISVEVAEPYLVVRANGSIVVVVGVNATWGRPQLTVGTLTGYDLWVGLAGAEPSEDEIVPIQVRRLLTSLWFCP